MSVRKLIHCLVIMQLLLPLPALADWDLSQILMYIQQIYGLNNTNLPYLHNLDDINKYTKNQLDALTSRNRYGNKNYKDFQSLGAGAERWQSALDVYNQGTGELGAVAKKLNQEFPINPNLKTVNPKATKDKFELLQAKTALASRAASQVAFDKVQKQIAYLQELKNEIDQTQDLKASVDLQNRLVLESNMLQLELLRLAALSNQQHAIQIQADVNQAVINKAYTSDLP